MANTSPRQTFRQRAVVPLKWDDASLNRVVIQLQDALRRFPRVVVSTTSDYTMNDLDALIKVNASGGARTITLLSAVAREGRRIIVKKTDSSANGVTVDAHGTETLDGSLTITLTQQNASREWMSDGENWQLVAAVGYAS